MLVALAVVAVFLGQGAFQAFIGPCVLWICEQVVSEPDVPHVFAAFRSKDIEVMRKVIGWLPECLAPRNTEITSMLISQPTQILDSYG